MSASEARLGAAVAFDAEVSAPTPMAEAAPVAAQLGAEMVRAGQGLVPRHVAIIMDGNRRWAKARRLPVALGHKAGADAARRTVRAAAESGIEWLTLFAFSSENWQRPADEVRELTGLLAYYLRSEVAVLVKERVRLRVIGDRARFGPEILRAIEGAEQATVGGTRLNLNVALSYGGRAEIVAAARALMASVQAGTLDPATLDEDMLSARLFTAGMPDPDLIIRTSGEQRLSNFLLWQAAYSEFLFVDRLWPDFSKQDLDGAVEDFARRERRYGVRAG